MNYQPYIVVSDEYYDNHFATNSVYVYIKSNDTAKQLPDKCINALDKWVDSYVKEENK